ncbi:MAG: aminoacyl-tRNA hydrolase [Patescibacteria group bacterium]|nr:aminoacyl-tRNA hydrolase [Patescibacteria group bacterium]
MSWTIVGLGNPKDEYEGTRHNVGQDVVAEIEEKLPSGAKVRALNVYMNNSGGAVRALVPSAKAAQKLVVVHDELDLPLGKIKISTGGSGGGHNGVKSIIRALKTEDFVRVRIGISPSSPAGKPKRPDGKKVVDFVLGKFRPPEREKLKKVKKLLSEALALIVEHGVDRAQSEINAR